MRNHRFQLGGVLVLTILITWWSGSAESSPMYQVSPASYQPPTHVTVEMYELFQNGASTGNKCDAADENGQYVYQYRWGCTAYCNNLPLCDTSQTYPFPMLTNPTSVEIDGTSGAPDGSPYNQYLRDVVPQELGIELASQGNKPLSAVEAQAIAARTYIYQRMEYIGQYGTPNNSTQFQVFVPYRYDTLTDAQKRRVQAATANRVYLTEADSTYPIEALYGADNPGSTAQGNRPYLKSVPDPISAAYGAWNGTTNGGMSSKGASRWSFGHTSSWGPVVASHPNYPHDVNGLGDFWSVRFAEAAQILTHYYIGIHLRDADTLELLTPVYRWNPLQITWSGSCPPLMNHGQSCTASVQVQNTGTVDWNCGPVGYVLSYRWAKTGHGEVNGASQASLCGTGKGAAPTVTLALNDLPNWGAGAYTLKLDMARTLSGQKFWFRDAYGWYSYDLSLCVDGPCRVFLPRVAQP